MKDQGLWTWHVAAGVVILVFLGLHMGVMHLEAVLGLPASPAGGHPIDWGNVVARAKSAFFAVTYVVLLGAALFHGLYGARNVLFELGPGPAVKKTVNGVFLVAGLGLFVLGTWAAWATFLLARAS
jgi:succinate dehydrogenase / fumarate reductase membrane anchor subunit